MFINYQIFFELKLKKNKKFNLNLNMYIIY